MPTVHLIVKGKVQGVFYRATAKKIADEIGITGWIKNTPDDCVEIVASGLQQALQQFIEWCRKDRQERKVSEVKVAEMEEETFDEFINQTINFLFRFHFHCINKFANISLFQYQPF